MTLPESVPPFVDETFVLDHLDEVVLVDVRWSGSGVDPHAAYVAGHLPGAVRLDLDDDLAAPPSAAGGRHPLPDPDDFAAACRRVGIGDDDVVVAYDDGHGGFAARLVWMLRVTGHRAAVLSGGLEGWNGEREAGEVTRPPSSFTATAWPDDAIVDTEAAGRLASGDDTALVDARAAERYRGEVEPLDPRAGHVPGAVSRPFTGNLDHHGRILPPDVLRERFADLADLDGVAVSCGSGVTACHDVLAMEHAGLDRPRLYVGSWSAWSSDPERPVATGD